MDLLVPFFMFLSAGNPVSPYIFIICAEILALLIRKKTIKGINMVMLSTRWPNLQMVPHQHQMAQKKCLYAAMSILQFFEMFSGLRVNTEKNENDMDSVKKVTLKAVS